MAKQKKNAALEKHLGTVVLPVAKKAALEAGALIKRKFGKFKNLKFKADTSLVTEVDRESEKIIVTALRKKFPQHHILAEETGLSQGNQTSAFRWHIDPLDGTTNFVHRFPMFCVSIGLEAEDLGPVLGVIYHPIHNELYWASHGGGAFHGKNRIHVSKTKELSQGLLSTGFSLRREKFFEDELATFGRMSKSSHALRRTGSAALDLTLVATGQFDGFWERGLSPWDMAAALAILGEAGGVYTRIDGKNFRLGDESIAATNGLIHQEFLAALNGFDAD
ncbi:MAG: inositol monophosphatase family protein [Bdellovibrionota bacterium]